MAKQSSVNLDITNNADGFDISGGTTVRKLGITGGDVTIAGSGSATVTFPTTSTTIAGLGITQSFSALQSFSAGISAAGGVTLAGTLQGTTASFTGLVSSAGGFSGAGTNLTNVAKLNTSNTFTSGSYLTLSGSGLFGMQSEFKNNSIIFTEMYDGGTTTLLGQPNTGAANTVTLPNTTGTIALTNGTVASFNGKTGAVQGVSAAVGSTYLTVSGSTGSVTFTNTGVQTFNGLTGAVTGVTVGGTNVFTALNTFNAGISAAGGVTFATDISVNSIRVGKGAGNQARNVALGSNTLTLNTTGDYNLAIGADALASNLTGTDNVGLGYGALTSNTSSNNLGIGSSSLGLNTTGSDNVGVGTGSLGANTTGSRNVGIGRSSLSMDGNDNVGIGAYSLSNILSARNQNTAIGSDAGRYRTGALNLQGATGGIYIGYGAKGSANAQTNEIVIGTLAEALGSNTAVIGATTQTAATIYGVLRLPGGLSAASGITLSGNVAMTSTSSHTGLASFAGGLSAAGSTFSGNVNLQDNTLSRIELLDYCERYVDLGDFTSKLSQIPIDLSTGQVFRTKITTACTGLNVTNTPDNANANTVGFTLLFVGDGTARSMTWNIGSTAIGWAGGIAPTYTSTLNKIDVYSFLTRDGGSNWLGFVGGQNF